MTTPTHESRTSTTSSAGPVRSAGPVYSSLVGLAALVVLLQGVWAGIFLKPGGITSPS